MLFHIIVVLIVCIFLHQPELVTEDEAGHAEIDGGLNPEDAELGEDLADASTHTVHTDKGAHAEGAGE